MIAYQTTLSDWRSHFAGAPLLGQSGGAVVIEIDSLPPGAEGTALSNDALITQRVFPGRFGAQITYAGLNEIRRLLEELGEYGYAAGSLSELKLRKEITDIQLALVEGS